MEELSVVYPHVHGVSEGTVHLLLIQSGVRWEISKEPRCDINVTLYWLSCVSNHSWEVVSGVILPTVVSHNSYHFQHS